MLEELWWGVYTGWGCVCVCVCELGVEVSRTLRDGLRGAPPLPPPHAPPQADVPPNHGDTVDRQGQTED